SRAMTKDEINKVEAIVNQWISENHPQKTKIMDVQEAINSGATALFGEKYEDKVRMVAIGDVSKELCGGTHVNSTSDIRLMKIVSESAISAGTRRIEAVCGNTAIEYLSEKASEIDKLAHMFKVPHIELIDKIEKMSEENKALQAEINTLKEEAAVTKIQSFISKAEEITDGKLFVSKVDGLPAMFMKPAIEKINSKLGNSIIILASIINEHQISICTKVSDIFVQKGINAGKIVAEIAAATGGKGGGRPNFAQGGGKDAANLDEILLKIKNNIFDMLK
ncbi:MAG: DHHA1 domain-containing protein, partial [Candidatus Gastranaerophilaceae bacterium]